MSWGTVTQVAPLRVRIDGAVSASPATLMSGEAGVSDRVYVLSTNPLLVTASSSGIYATTADLLAEQNRAEDAEGLLGDAVADHLADTTAVHAASAISFNPAGTISATTVQAALEEVASEAGGGGGSTSFASILKLGVGP